METGWTKKSLIEFEDEIAQLFLEGKVHGPIHLSGGNEEQLVRIFEEHINESDWILSNWRSHFHCLLKGVPPDQVRQAILDGKSISLCFPEYRVLSSGIAGGTAPIAVGLALGIKRKREAAEKLATTRPIYYNQMSLADRQRKVVCFIGEMSFEMGIVHESIKYATNFDLPVLWVVESNGMSVGTPTRVVWGESVKASAGCIEYNYQLTRPHVGCGKFVEF